MNGKHLRKVQGRHARVVAAGGGWDGVGRLGTALAAMLRRQPYGMTPGAAEVRGGELYRLLMEDVPGLVAAVANSNHNTHIHQHRRHAVLAEHRPDVDGGASAAFCLECAHSYPCRTVRLLTGQEA